MLTGEITVELYDKLAKRYEEKIKQKGTPTPQPTIQSPPPSTSDSPSTETTTPTVAMPSEQPKLGLTPDSPELQKKKEKK